MPDLNEQMRAEWEAFTAWALDEYHFSLDAISAPMSVTAWAAWQAARRQHGSAAGQGKDSERLDEPSDEAVANAVRAFVNAGKRGKDLFGAMKCAIGEVAAIDAAKAKGGAA